MKTKTALIILLSTLFLFQIPTSSIAFWNRDGKKAKEFMEAGMYPQAIELLNKRVYEKPTDVEAHFQLGICYINTGKYSNADERFASAVRLVSTYGYKIGEEYMKAGQESLQNNQIEKADQLFQKAVRYQPNLRINISKEIFNKGKSLLNQGMRPYENFDLAIKFDEGLREKICDIIYAKGKLSTGMGKEIYYQGAMRYCNKYDQEIKTYLCDLYFHKGKSASTDDNLRYFRKAKQYCNKYDKQIPKHLLTIANKIDDERLRWRYIEGLDEYITESDILSATVEYNTMKFGKPKVIELTKIGGDGWISVCRVENQDRLHYFTLQSIKYMTQINQDTGTFKKRLNSTWGLGVRFYGLKEGSDLLKFHKDKKNAVYVWLERQGMPVDLNF